MSRATRIPAVRLALATAGVATSTLLVLAIGAVYRSVQQSAAGYTGQQGADIWVAPAGTDNLLRTTSALFPRQFADSVRALPGVSAAAPIVRGYLTVKGRRGDEGTRLTLLGIGYEAPDGLGGPPLIARGRAPHGSHEVLLDRAAAHRLALDIGDTAWVSGRAAVVVGLSRGTNLFATQFLFGDIAAAGPASGVAGKASFLIVRLAPGADAASVAAAIERQWPDLAAFVRTTFVAKNAREVSEGFLPLLVLIGVLGVSGAAVLVTVLLHSTVEYRRVEMAVLLALGARTSSVGYALLLHAARLMIAGGLVGIGLTLALAAALDWLLPTVPLTLIAADVVRVLGLFLACALGAAVVPLTRLGRIDPLEAFRP